MGWDDDFCFIVKEIIITKFPSANPQILSFDFDINCNINFLSSI